MVWKRSNVVELIEQTSLAQRQQHLQEMGKKNYSKVYSHSVGSEINTQLFKRLFSSTAQLLYVAQ